MARQVTREETRRTRVQTTGQVVPLEVNARVSDGGARPAFQLAELIQAGGQLFQAIEEPRQTAQAAKDFETGDVDENGGHFYRQKVDSLKARAWWAQDEKLLREKMQDLDLANMSGPELNGWIDEELGNLYSGIDDPTMLNELAPRMAAFRQQINEEVYVMQSEAEVAENAANIQQIAETNYATGSFDYHAMYRDIAGDDQNAGVFKGAEINEVYFKVISDMAIRNGDPDLIRNIPDRWETGMATFKHIPDWNERILNAEIRATSAQAALQKSEQDALEDAQGEMFSELVKKADELVRLGDHGSAQQLVDEIRSLDFVEGDDILKLRRDLNAVDTIEDVQSANEGAVARLTGRVYDGTAGQAEIYSAYLSGVFGDGKQSVARMTSLMDKSRLVKNERSSNPVFASADYRLYKKGLEDKYKPDAITGKFDKSMADVQRQAREEYHELVGSGTSPAEASAQVFEKWDPIVEKGHFSLGQSRAYKDPAVAIDLYLNGRMSTTEFNAAGMNEERVMQMKRADQLTADEARRILSKLAQ